MLLGHSDPLLKYVSRSYVPQEQNNMLLRLRRLSDSSPDIRWQVPSGPVSQEPTAERGRVEVGGAEWARSFPKNPTPRRQTAIEGSTDRVRH